MQCACEYLCQWLLSRHCKCIGGVILYMHCSVVSILSCIQCLAPMATCMSLYIYLLHLYYYVHVDLILHVYCYLLINDAAGYNVIHLLLLHVQLPWHAAYAHRCAYGRI